MSNNHRRMVGTVGMAAAGLLAPPLIALLASPVASADPSGALVIPDPISTFGPYTFDGFTDTFSLNTTTDAFDNYLTGALGGINLDLDIYSPAANTYDVLLTDPGLFQFGVDDVGGVLSYTDSFVPADFVTPDIGLGLL